MMEAPRIETASEPQAPEVLADLERKIAHRTAGRIRGLKVEVVGDSVVLCGRTTTYYVKQLATQVALDEHAEFCLLNSIEVV